MSFAVGRAAACVQLLRSHRVASRVLAEPKILLVRLVPHGVGLLGVAEAVGRAAVVVFVGRSLLVAPRVLAEPTILLVRLVPHGVELLGVADAEGRTASEAASSGFSLLAATINLAPCLEHPGTLIEILTHPADRWLFVVPCLEEQIIPII